METGPGDTGVPAPTWVFWSTLPPPPEMSEVAYLPLDLEVPANRPRSEEVASDFAWEHAKELVSSVCFNLGSTQWESTWRRMAEGYSDCGDHSGFLRFLATGILVRLLDDGLVLRTGPERDAADATAELDALIGTIESVLWFTAGTDPGLWENDYEWSLREPSDRRVVSRFSSSGDFDGCGDQPTLPLPPPAS